MRRSPPRSPPFPYAPLFGPRQRELPLLFPRIAPGRGGREADRLAEQLARLVELPLVHAHLAELGEGERVLVQVAAGQRSEEHTSELQSRQYLVCRLLLEKTK